MRKFKYKCKYCGGVADYISSSPELCLANPHRGEIGVYPDHLWIEVTETAKLKPKKLDSERIAAFESQRIAAIASFEEELKKELKEREERKEKYFREKVYWKSQGLCEYCGGKLSGLFIKKCKSCGKKNG